MPATLSTVKKHAAILVSIAFLVLMAALMATPIREESATADESVFLLAGYNYWHGYGFAIDPEAPPLAKMISAAPLLFMKVEAPMGLSGPARPAVIPRWSGEWQLVDEHFPVGRDNWYFWRIAEGQTLAQSFLYGGANDADKLLAAARWMQVALTVLTGIAMFLWLRQLAGGMAGALGTALWALNPIALAYGHLVLTDMGVTLMFVLAVWSFTGLLDRPSTHRAVWCGLACGGALVMKFSAVLLAPILLVLVGLHVMVTREWRGLGKHLTVMVLTAAGVVLLIYAPHWAPAPPLPGDQAAKMGVPTWFQVLRPVLIPRDFFKGLALVAAHESKGQGAFLCGQWRTTGWWYYFLVAMAVKTPLPLLLLTMVGLGLWLRGMRRFSFQQAAPWLAALMYLMFAMVGTIDIGVRHLLPMFALLAVGSASQFGLRSRRVQLCAWLGIGWLLVVTWRARPNFIEYFNEAVGGPANGYRWLVDSNLDWGQDAKRLKHFLDEQGITNINLEYFGPRRSIEYYGVSGRRITSDEAPGIHSGTLIISATTLMSTSWDWLRACHEPVARIGYTMFVYHLGDTVTKDRWEQALRINPNDVRAHYNLGIVLERSGQAQDAITHYEQAVRINPDYAEAQYNLGLALAQLGKLPEAIGHYQRTLRIRPDGAKAHYNLGAALMRLGRLQDAIGHFEWALRIKPDLAEAHHDLGLALAQLGRLPEAIEHWELALRIDPDYAEAQYNLGLALAQLGREPEAIEHWEQALHINPDFAEAHYNLGLALEKAGREPEAIQHYEQALRIKPDFTPAHNALARLQARQ